MLSGWVERCDMNESFKVTDEKNPSRYNAKPVQMCDRHGQWHTKMTHKDIRRLRCIMATTDKYDRQLRLWGGSVQTWNWCENTNDTLTLTCHVIDKLLTSWFDADWMHLGVLIVVTPRVQFAPVQVPMGKEPWWMPRQEPWIVAVIAPRARLALCHILPIQFQYFQFFVIQRRAKISKICGDCRPLSIC